MTDDTFTLPPNGMLSEQITLADHRLALGLLHIDGAGLRVCAWDGGQLRHMAPAAARRWASDLENSGHGPALKPVTEGLHKLVGRIEEISLRRLRNAHDGLISMAVEGRA